MRKRYPMEGLFYWNTKRFIGSVAIIVFSLYPFNISALWTESGLFCTAPTDKIVAILPLPTQRPAPTTTAIKQSSVWVTAYASTPDETSDHPFITASGEHVRDGIIASNFLPFGTEVTIPKLFGSKVFTVEDRMNSLYNGRIDIWMPTRTAALDFGIRKEEVDILPASVLATIQK